jgi:hypothetical protein
MSPFQQKVLGLRLADGTDDERQLNERLVAIGGDTLCLPLGPNPESENGWVSWLLEHGQLIDGPITQRRKGISGCHQNVATIWRRKQYGITGICSGYVLSDDGLWRAHTWGLLPGGGILEITIARQKYLGLVHEGEMADAFADMTLEGEKSVIPRAAATRRRKCSGGRVPEDKGQGHPHRGGRPRDPATTIYFKLIYPLESPARVTASCPNGFTRLRL